MISTRCFWSSRRLRLRSDCIRKNLNEALAFIRQNCQFPIHDKDAGTIEGIYREFFDQQLDIRFRSFGRPSFRFYPSFKDIVLERDLEGKVRKLSQFGSRLSVRQTDAQPQSHRAGGGGLCRPKGASEGGRIPERVGRERFLCFMFPMLSSI